MTKLDTVYCIPRNHIHSFFSLSVIVIRLRFASKLYLDKSNLDFVISCRFPLCSYNTSQQDFGTRKVYCVSNVTFHAESKYAIKIKITHSFCTMAFLIIDFSEFLVFSSVIFFIHEQIF